MRLFITITKKTLAVILMAILVLFLTAAWLTSVKFSMIDGSTHAKRASYIKSLGYDIDGQKVTSKEIIIPDKFGDVYGKYNELQKQAGFDLSDYKGKKATVYTYPLWEDDRVIHLIVVEGKIVGGDICETAVDGKMEPLK
ncbi:MAG: DUF4830 domain-containing protein [Acutalibacteraceae bacterium]|jgi:hypothetical protein